MNTYLSKPSLNIFLILLFTPLSAWSLETVVVSGTRFDSSLLNTPAGISVITAEEIRSSGVAHVVDALRNGGGLQISDLFGDGTDANIGLRGFSATAGQNTLIMIDGRRLNNADNGLPDLNSLSVHDVEQIELVKSSMSTLYGDKAVGGAINIITRKPVGPRMQADVNYGSYNNRSVYAAIENSHKNGIDYRISAQRRLSDNYRSNNRLRLTTVNTRGSYDHLGGNVFMEIQGSSERIELPGALFVDLLQADPRQALNPEDAISTDVRAGRIGIEQKIMDFVDFRAEYTNRFNEIEGTISSAGNAESFQSKRHHVEITPRLAVNFKLMDRKSGLYFGVDWFQTDYLIESRFGLTDNTQTQYGYYGRFTTSITDGLDLVTGYRLGIVQNDILVDTLSFGRSLPEGTELDDTTDAYEAGFSYQLNTYWRLFAKFEKNYRFVTADEYSAIADNNFFSQLFGSGTAIPLPATQSGYSFETGLEYRNKGSLVNLQFYQLRIKDEIVFDPVSFLNTNLGDTRRNGMILDGRYSVTDDISVSGYYSYLDAEFTSGGFKGNNLSFLARHSASASVDYKITDDLGMFIDWHGQGNRILDGDYSNNFKGLSGYGVFSFNVRYQVEKLKVGIRINNLLNKRYSDSGVIGFDFRQPFPSPLAETYYPAPRRNLMLSLSYDI